MNRMGHTLNWKAFANCTPDQADVFFSDSAAKIARAKVICAGCPVREECRHYALTHRLEFGVWGGQSARERNQIIRRRYGRRPYTHRDSQ